MAAAAAAGALAQRSAHGSTERFGSIDDTGSGAEPSAVRHDPAIGRAPPRAYE
jgi:hypothetical protein